MKIDYHRPESVDEMRDTISSRFNKEMANEVCGRVECATAKDWISMDVERLDEFKYRITVWITEVEDDSKFYDQWYSELHVTEVNSEDMRIIIDIR